MPLRYLLLPFFILFVGAASVRAQTPVDTDYLVTNASDTLRGKLQLTRFVSENGVLLKTSADAEPQRFTAAQIKGFGTADGRRFIRQFLTLENQELRARGAVARPQALDSIPVLLQVVATGKAQLYLLNYRLNGERNAMEYSEFETGFIYLQAPGSVLTRLREPTFRDVVRAQLPGCQAVEVPLRNARFTALALAKVVQAYNSACGAGFGPPTVLPVTARKPEQEGLRFGRLGLRAGATLGTAFYPNSPYTSSGQARGSWTLGLSFQSQGQGHWGFVSGLYLTSRSNESFLYEEVPGSYLNGGDIITLRQQLAVRSVQVPLLVQCVTRPVNGAQLFVALGPVLGANFNNITKQDEAADIFVPGQFVTARGSREVNVNTEESARFHPTLGGQVGVGVRRKVGVVTLVGELFFERGREISASNSNGAVHHQNGGLRIGLDF